MRGFWNPTGVDPTAMVDAINQAQAERRAAQAEIDSAPVAAVLAVADVHAMIDSLGDVSAALDERQPASLERLYRALEPVGELITVRAGARKRIMAVGGVSRRR